MKRIALWMSAGLLLASCDKKTDTPQKPEATKADPAKPADVKADPASVTPSAGKKGWALNVDGEPALTGGMLTTQKVGDVTSYTFFGAPAMVSIGMRGEGTDPFMVNIGFTAQKEACFYRRENKQLSKGMTVKFDGDGRAEISGEITCSKVGETAPDKKNHKITGWFKP